MTQSTQQPNSIFSEKEVQDILEECQKIRQHIEVQPSCEDLGATDIWIRELNFLAARFTVIVAQVDSIFAKAVYQTVKALHQQPSFKSIKGSSTLVTEFVKGRFPRVCQAHTEAHYIEKIIKPTMDNTRTLVASFRDTYQRDQSSHIRNTEPMPESFSDWASQ
jgi:hypothetical protein